MRDQNIGDVLISDDGQLRGGITDRDLAVRAVALMREHSLRRSPVVQDARLVRVISLGDLAIERDTDSALADISAAKPNQ